MFIGIIDFTRQELTYINAGHNTIPLVQEDRVILLDKGSTILGMFEKLPFIEVTAMPLQKRNHLFLYTDGLSECMNEADEEFELERILPFIELDKLSNQSAMIDAIIAATVEFKGTRGYNDDITLLSCLIQF